MITIDREKCIGCGACSIIAEKTFRMDDAGKATVINPPEDDEETIKNAADGCPVAAILISE